MSPRAAAVFTLAADLTPREGRSHGEWIAEVTRRFTAGWAALENGL